MRKLLIILALLFHVIIVVGEESSNGVYDFNSSADEVEIARLLSSGEISHEDSLRLVYKLNLLMKNREGEKATDFLFYKKDGSQNSLYDVKADYVLMYFNDPDCETCKALKQELIGSEVLNNMLECGKVKLLSVCVEGENEEWKKQQLPELWIDACDKSMVIVDEDLYYLPSLPVLYLLDSNHHVIMKNTDVNEIEKYLKLSEIK